MHRVLTYDVSSTAQGGAQVSPGHSPASTRGTHTLELAQTGPPSSTDTTHPPPQELGSSVGDVPRACGLGLHSSSPTASEY